MPIFEYQCTKCGWEGEVLLVFSDKEPTECPKCKGEIVKVISAPSFRMTGRRGMQSVPDPIPPLQKLKEKGPREGCEGGYADLPEWSKPTGKKDSEGNYTWEDKKKQYFT